MKVPKNLAQAPQGDWAYTQPETGVKFKANHYKALKKQVLVYREANSSLGFDLATGWEVRFWDQVCQQNPYLPCVSVEEPEKSIGVAEIRRFMNTLNNLRKSGDALVSEDEQMRRLNICRSCPNFTTVSTCSEGCGWLAKALTEFVSGTKIKEVSTLKTETCGACGCLLKIKTTYPLEILQETDRQMGIEPDYPSFCWAK